MTLERLNKLREELKKLRDEIIEAEIKADSIPGGKITGMPSAKSSVNSKECSYISLIHKKETIFKEKSNKIAIKYSEEFTYIANIKEKTTHDIFNYYFLMGLKWREVAKKAGGNNSADGVRMHARRYIEKNP